MVYDFPLHLDNLAITWNIVSLSLFFVSAVPPRVPQPVPPAPHADPGAEDPEVRDAAQGLPQEAAGGRRGQARRRE